MTVGMLISEIFVASEICVVSEAWGACALELKDKPGPGSD